MHTNNSLNATIIIPARYSSTRFPAKMVAPLCGKPLVMHVYERARQAKLPQKTVIATDDTRIVDAVAPYTSDVVMTRADHASGTDRVAEVASRESADIIVNVQGDEVLIDPRLIDNVIQSLAESPDAVMATARRQIHEEKRLQDPNTVKVVCDQQGFALYFSRHPIPYVRDIEDRSNATWWQHIGIYAYRRSFLLQLSSLPQTPLEKLEKLEQLRVLENGFKIMVVDTDYEAIGVDTPEDFTIVEQLLNKQRRG